MATKPRTPGLRLVRLSRKTKSALLENKRKKQGQQAFVYATVVATKLRLFAYENFRNRRVIHNLERGTAVSHLALFSLKPKKFQSKSLPRIARCREKLEQIDSTVDQVRDLLDQIVARPWQIEKTRKGIKRRHGLSRGLQQAEYFGEVDGLKIARFALKQKTEKLRELLQEYARI